MTPHNFPGASYAAAARSFSAGFFADHVELGDGARIPTCGEGLLLAPAAGIVSGAFVFAGKGWGHGNAWLWNGQRWIDLGIEAYGANEGAPCAFFDGRVYVSTVGTGGKVIVCDGLTGARITEFTQDIGTEGIALVDAAGVHPQKPWYGLHGFGRYVEIGDVRIGQGPQGGLIGQIGDGPRKLLEAGSWQFIGVSEAAGIYAVAASQFPLRRAAVRWFDLRDIQIAADYIVTTPIVIPPPIKPPEKPMSGITDAQFATLQAERAKYASPTLTPEEIGAILNATAWQHKDDPGARLGLEKKSGGTIAIQPRTGTTIWNGLRIIAADGSHWGEDVCGGCSVGRFNPVRSKPDTATADGPKGFVKPVEPEGSVPPPVDPLPSSDLETRVKALEQSVSRILNGLHAV